MRGTRSISLSLVITLFTVALTSGAAPPAGLPRTADLQGRFTIGFPADWQVVKTKSGMPAVAAWPSRKGRSHLNVNVVVEELQDPISSTAYARAARPMMAATFHEFNVIQEGPARIAHRDAYYRYYTWRPNTGGELYQVQAYFTAGRLGFVLTGTTVNDPDRVRRDVPIIGEIFETFKPATR